jgi:uncharacterized protein YaaQ
VCVVEAREVVDVEDRDRNLELLAGRTRELQLQHALEGPAVRKAGEGVAVCHALGPVDALGGIRGHASSIDDDRDEVRKRSHSLADIEIGRVLGLEGQRADRLLDAIPADHDGPGELKAVSLGLAGALDALLGGKADRMVRLLDGRLERGQVVRWVAAGAGEGQATGVGVPEERSSAVRAGRTKTDLEELVEGRVGVAAARNRPDRGEKEGVRAQGGQMLDHPEGADDRAGAGFAAPILAAVKLVVAIIHNEDAGALVEGLLEKDYRATRLHSSGGFLKQSNATIVLGVEDDKVEDVIAIIAEHCTSRTQVVNPMPPIMEPGEFFMPYPLEVEVGGATVFVLGVDRFERL